MHLRIHKPRYPKKRYDPVGMCIYCGTTGGALGSEHIVPQGLGGAVELLAASCRRCEKTTSGIESKCISEVFDSARLHMGIPTRAGPNRKPSIRARVSYDNHSKIVKAAIPDYPLSLFLPGWGRPTSLLGLPPRETDRLNARFWLYKDAEWRTRLSRLGARRLYHQGEFTLSLFMRLLAKIAHSYAAAEIETKAFDAVLPPLIRGGNNAPGLTHWVGCDDIIEVASLALHEVGLYRERVETQQNNLIRIEEFWVARIRLFAKLGAPTYRVVVGRPV